jgi:hypothetical protein
MNLFRKTIFPLTIIGVIAGCAQSAITPTQTTVPLTTPSFASFSVTTNTFTPPSVIKEISTPTIQPIEEIKLEGECMALEDELPSDLHLSGVLIRQRASPYLENLEDHTKYKVPLEGGGVLDDMVISPDSKLLAYLDRYVNSSGQGTDKWEFRILKSNGHLMILQNWIFDVRGILGWASNDEIVLKVFSKRIKYIVYNPFNGESREIIIDPAIVYNPYDEIIFHDRFGDYFNPDKIVFQTIDGNKLYDVKTWKKLLNFDLGYISRYAWSPDLSTVLINPGTDEDQRNLYIVKNDDVFFKLNAVASGFAVENSDSITGDSWAPNNQKFIIYSWSKLAFMNLETLEVRRLCITYDPEFEISYPFPSIWSPDSRFLILHYSKYNPQGKWEYFDVLIDTQNMRAFKLPTNDRNEYRMGWLAVP